MTKKEMQEAVIEANIQSIITDLSYQLDAMVYLPTKEELLNVPHSLGMRKENFKSYLQTRCLQALQNIKNGKLR